MLDAVVAAVKRRARSREARVARRGGLLHLDRERVGGKPAPDRCVLGKLRGALSGFLREAPILALLLPVDDPLQQVGLAAAGGRLAEEGEVALAQIVD